jgi:hypothetical protein
VRVAVLAAVVLLSACASEELRLAPPPGVDFSGRWQLNEADSDDPLHLLQAANSQQLTNSGNTGNTGGRGGRSGRGGSPGGYPTPAPVPTPSMGVLSEALRFPGKQIEVRQVGGVVTLTSDGKSRACKPSRGNKGSQHHGGSKDRDAPPATRDAPPPTCGWSEKTLIVKTRDVDDDVPPFEEHYSLTEDGQRLVEEVSFRGGRSSGFVMSRVWDKLPQ